MKLTSGIVGIFAPEKTGIGEEIAISWAINDPPGLQGLKDEDRGRGGYFLSRKRPTGTQRVKRLG